MLLDFLKKTDEVWLYDVLPLTANMADDIEFHFQRLVEICDACDSGEVVDQEDRARKEVTLHELLIVAARLNYADSDFGREQMTLVMRGTPGRTLLAHLYQV